MKFARFETWAAVVAHCKAGLPLYYQAPFDRSPVRVDYKLPTRKPRGSMVGGDGWKECIRIIPCTNDADPFVAFMDHLSRMRRLAAEES
jgi:hypothetical protein